MLNIKLKKKLKSLEKEVHDFHPVLDSLFRKIPTISAVDYNQGPNEKGADFVLTRPSVELGGVDYIGVIVKIGKIKATDTGVNRQIEECKLRRFVENGNREIYLDEIWIACNDTVTHNAKEKIWETYNGQKIKFLDIDCLAKLVDKHIPGWFGNIDIRDSDFLANERMNAIKFESITSLLTENQAELYLPQNIVTKEIDEFGHYTSSKPIDIYSTIEQNTVIFLEAAMGGGKSKLMLNIIKHYCDNLVYAEKKIMPFYKSCRDFLNPDFNIEHYLDEIISNNNLKDDSERIFLLIFDGLDEVERSSDFVSEKVSETISFAKNKEIKILLTSRVVKDKNLEACLTEKSTRLELQPLNLASIMKFIDKISVNTNIETRLVEDLKKSNLFRELPRTPISAILLATILKDNIDELPSSITELYAQYTELALGRWDVNKGLTNQKEFEAGRIIISNIATYFMDNQLSVISQREALNFFVDYLSQRNLQIDAELLMEKLTSRSGIVFLDTREKTFGFKHRSFLQFFYAVRLNLKSSIELNAVIFHPYWVTSYFFLFGLKKDCPELLDQLMELEPPSGSEEGFRYSRLTNFGSFLLASYNSPYNKIKEGIEFIFTEAASLYLEVVSEPEKYTLSKFPNLQLLGLISYILSDQYSFNFFKKAIQNSLLNIDSEHEKDMYKLFFLDLSNSNLGDEHLMSMMTEKQSNNLPTPIKVIIASNSNAKNYTSKVLSKIVKKYHKRRKSSKVFQQEVMNLAFVSIDGTVDALPNRALNPKIEPSKRKALRAKRKNN